MALWKIAFAILVALPTLTLLQTLEDAPPDALERPVSIKNNVAFVKKGEMRNKRMSIIVKREISMRNTIKLIQAETSVRDHLAEHCSFRAQKVEDPYVSKVHPNPVDRYLKLGSLVWFRNMPPTTLANLRNLCQSQGLLVPEPQDADEIVLFKAHLLMISQEYKHPGGLLIAQRYDLAEGVWRGVLYTRPFHTRYPTVDTDHWYHDYYHKWKPADYQSWKVLSSMFSCKWYIPVDGPSDMIRCHLSKTNNNAVPDARYTAVGLAGVDNFTGPAVCMSPLKGQNALRGSAILSTATVSGAGNNTRIHKLCRAVISKITSRLNGQKRRIESMWSHFHRRASGTREGIPQIDWQATTNTGWHPPQVAISGEREERPERGLPVLAILSALSSAPIEAFKYLVSAVRGMTMEGKMNVLSDEVRDITKSLSDHSTQISALMFDRLRTAQELGELKVEVQSLKVTSSRALSMLHHTVLVLEWDSRASRIGDVIEAVITESSRFLSAVQNQHTPDALLEADDMDAIERQLLAKHHYHLVRETAQAVTVVNPLSLYPALHYEVFSELTAVERPRTIFEMVPLPQTVRGNRVVPILHPRFFALLDLERQYLALTTREAAECSTAPCSILTSPLLVKENPCGPVLRVLKDADLSTCKWLPAGKDFFFPTNHCLLYSVSHEHSVTVQCTISGDKPTTTVNGTGCLYAAPSCTITFPQIGLAFPGPPQAISQAQLGQPSTQNMAHARSVWNISDSHLFRNLRALDPVAYVRGQAMMVHSFLTWGFTAVCTLTLTIALCCFGYGQRVKWYVRTRRERFRRELEHIPLWRAADPAEGNFPLPPPRYADAPMGIPLHQVSPARPPSLRSRNRALARARAFTNPCSSPAFKGNPPSDYLEVGRPHSAPYGDAAAAPSSAVPDWRLELAVKANNARVQQSRARRSPSASGSRPELVQNEAFFDAIPDHPGPVTEPPADLSLSISAEATGPNEEADVSRDDILVPLVPPPSPPGNPASGNPPPGRDTGTRPKERSGFPGTPPCPKPWSATTRRHRKVHFGQSATSDEVDKGSDSDSGSGSDSSSPSLIDQYEVELDLGLTSGSDEPLLSHSGTQ